MPKIAIREIIFDPVGGVKIAPALEKKGYYSQIYRAAMSVRWDHDAQEFYMVPRNVGDRSPLEAVKAIVSVIVAECGDNLVITAATVWRGISSVDQEAMLALQRHKE
jgi:hypothetical protein